jgi:hypothetical protein
MPQYYYSSGPVQGSGETGVPLEIVADGTATGGAFMAFHRPGLYATRFGVDQNNEFTFGGWSEGDTGKYRFWTQKNFNPSGNAIDAYNSYGVRADGTDQTANIRAALSAAVAQGKPAVTLPAGRITVNDVITIPNGVSLIGQGRESTTIVSTNAYAAILATARDTVLSGAQGLSVEFAGALPSSDNACGFLIQGNRGHFDQVRAYNTANAFAIRGGNNNLFSNYIAEVFSLTGVLNEGTTELLPGTQSYRGAIDNFWVSGRLENPGSASYAQYGTVRLVNNCEGFHMSQLSALGGRYSLVVDSVSEDHGRRPQFMFFEGCMFDSSIYGCELAKLSQTKFTDCWFAGAGFDPTGNPGHVAAPGVHVQGTCFDLTFTACYFNQNAGSGVKVDPGAQDTNFTACTFVGNGRWGDAQGIDFYGNGVQVNHCKFYNQLRGVGAFPGGQTYSIVVRAGADWVILTGNIARSNPMVDQSSGTRSYNANLGL